MTPKRWSVRKREGRWRVIDRDTWHDTADTLEEAHTYATQLAAADVLFDNGGLTRLDLLLKSEAFVRAIFNRMRSDPSGRFEQDFQNLLSSPQGSGSASSGAGFDQPVADDELLLPGSPPTGTVHG